MERSIAEVDVLHGLVLIELDHMGAGQHALEMVPPHLIRYDVGSILHGHGAGRCQDITRFAIDYMHASARQNLQSSIMNAPYV